MTTRTRPSFRKRVLERIAVALLLLGVCSIAIAKLPPPTPEEQAQAEAKKAKAAEDAQTEKTLLEKAQDRIAAHYLAVRRAKGLPAGPAQAASSGSDGSSEVPAAALNSRPREKAGSYNEAVTPQSAPSASSGTATDSAQVPQSQTRK